MVKIEDMLLWYWAYKTFIESPRDDEERQEEIEEIMDEYWVDEDEAEEILDNM